MLRYVFSLLLLCVFVCSASAQTASQKEARNVAILKAVVNYKINDEENIKDVEKLRQDKRFNQRLVKMLEKLSNGRTKDSKNKQVLDVLEKAGDDLYNILK